MLVKVVCFVYVNCTIELEVKFNRDCAQLLLCSLLDEQKWDTLPALEHYTKHIKIPLVYHTRLVSTVILLEYLW